MKYLKMLGIATLVLGINACERDDPKPTGEKTVGGKGGNAILNVTAQHHNKNIDSCKIYIRYNATSAGAYDDSANCVTVNGIPVAKFSGLKKGDYYLYGDGWDPSIEEEVKGGAPITVTEEKEQNIYVAVTEKH